MDFSRIKKFSKEKVKAQFGMALLLTILASICMGIPSATGVGAIASIILIPPFTLSLINVYVTILAGDKPEFKEVFSGFSDWWSSVKVYLLTGIRTFLWSLLFVIPGIIKSIAYSQAMYILSEKPGMSARECLRESERLMNGNKMRYFLFQLSFIGWWILCTITCGIALIWFIPYYNACCATFYIDIRPSTKSSDSTSTESAQSTTSSAPNKTITFGNSGNNGANQK